MQELVSPLKMMVMQVFKMYGNAYMFSAIFQRETTFVTLCLPPWSM